jgi:hypothetical protein
VTMRSLTSFRRSAKGDGFTTLAPQQDNPENTHYKARRRGGIAPGPVGQSPVESPCRLPGGTIMDNVSDRFSAAIARIDAANAQDPTLEPDGAGGAPKQLLYSRRMTEWLNRIEPAASEALRLAVRAQHICRWRIPRSDYPMDRSGYLRWRSELGRFHAELTGQIMRDAGYDEAMIQRVQSLIRKEGIKRDPEAQTLEDVACLVFLQHYFAGFAPRHDEQKLIPILRKTWKKMSPRAHEQALQLDLPDHARSIIGKALAPQDAPEAPPQAGPSAP